MKSQIFWCIPILQVPFYRLCPCQLWSALPLLVFSMLFRIPLLTGASGGLRWICPNHLSRCWTSFSLQTTLVASCRSVVLYFVGTLYCSRANHMTVLGILSYAFPKLMKTICMSFYSLYLSISWKIKKVVSIDDLLGIKLN
jgi:hypothetical protein